MNTVLVSSCLLGICSRYDGRYKLNQSIIDYIRDNRLIAVPICPEQLGGLPTPRAKSWFTQGDGDRVLSEAGSLHNEMGEDVTLRFLTGAQEALKIALLCNAKTAILQQRSPSCGFGTVYLNHELIRGNGVTAALLSSHGLTVISDDKITK